MFVQRRMIFCLVLMMLLGIPVHASELWIQREKLGSTTFLTLKDDQLIINAFPTSDGVIYTEDRTGFRIRDGWLGMGYRNRQNREIRYSTSAGQFIYYFLNKIDLTANLTAIDFSMSDYQSEDFMVEIFQTYHNLEFNAGYMLSRGRDLFFIQAYDGMARHSDTAILGYDYRSYCTLWQASRSDQGIGSGYYLNLKYHPTDHLTFTLAGDDLAHKMVWDGIDEYRGIIDLNFVRSNLNGDEYVTSPLKGDYYNKNSHLVFAQAPQWQGKLHFQKKDYQIESWTKYRYTWEVGVKGTVSIQPNLAGSLGLAVHHSKLIYLAGLETPHLKIDLLFDHLQKEQITNLFINGQVYLFN